MIRSTFLSTVFFGAASFSEVEPAFFVQLLICVSAVALLANQVKSLFQKNPPLHVQYATRAEVLALTERLGKLEDGIAESLKEIQHDGNQSAKEIYKRINCIDRDLSATKTQSELTAQRVALFDGKLDNILSTLAKKKDER